ncbi:hydroxylysine kinase-like [Babylonia areolata]|uniref:hydroxylysine kinase-like n=1 Tax=Babylonia areolata TaxID=304850 RepID=UPI003FD07E7D
MAMRPKPRTPPLSVAIVTTLVRDLYGLHVQSCKELDSFMDRNYHVVVKAGNEHVGEVCAEGYVLKVLNSVDSRDPADVRTETAVLQYLYGRGLGTPRLVPTTDGHPFVLCSFQLHGHQESYELAGEEEQEGEDGEKHAVRLLEFMPGRPLSSVRLTPHLCFQLGVRAAQLTTALMEFDDSGLKVPGETWTWKMENLTNLRHIVEIRETTFREQIVDVIDAFESKLLKNNTGKAFKRGYIHCDLNPHNVLVSTVTENNSGPSLTTPLLPTSSSSTAPLTPEHTQVDNKGTTPPSSSSSTPSSSSSPFLTSSEVVCVSGVLDFGDMTKTYVMLDPAIAMSESILHCPEGEPSDAFAGHVLSGYLSELKLSHEEVELLPLVIKARFCQHLVLGQHALSQDPHNQYMASFFAPAQRHFSRLCHVPDDVTLRQWRDVAHSWGVHFPQES